MKGKSLITPIMIASGITAAGCLVYSRRIRVRVPSQEGLEDPQVTRAFNRVARMPQMRLLRWYAINRAINLASAGHAVDLGCGPGYLVQELAKTAPGLQVTGIDISSDMVAQAKEFMQKSEVAGRVDFKLGDAGEIPFPDHSMELVISTLSLHHWTDPVSVFNEIARVLKPGGAYLIFDLRRDMFPPAYLLIWFVTSFVVPAALYHINEPLGSRNAAYTPNEAAELVAQSSLNGWQVTAGPLWLTIEGRTKGD